MKLLQRTKFAMGQRRS